MTRAQERLGRSLARAIRSLEFDTKLTDRKPLGPDLVDKGMHGARIEIRHPRIEHRGALWLVAVIVLEPAPTITYAAPPYRRTLELVLRRALSAKAA